MNDSKRIFQELDEAFGGTRGIVSSVDKGSEDFYVDGEPYVIKFVDSDTGDGDGAATWYVFNVSKVDKSEPEFLFRITGTRSSWFDNYFDAEMEVVHAKPVLVTQYHSA